MTALASFLKESYRRHLANTGTSFVTDTLAA